MKRNFNKLLAAVLTASLCIPAFPAEYVPAAVTDEIIWSDEETVLVNNNDVGSTRSSNFNEGWKFYLGDSGTAQNPDFIDSSWKDVNLPHDFSISQNFTSSYEAESGFLPGGTGWYRKKFTLPDTLEGKSIVLNFDGVYSDAYVYINGTPIGEHHYGYTPFAFDISDLLHCDNSTENVIAVKAVNNIPTSRWYSGSGIYRDVSLIVTDPVHVAQNGTFVTTPNLEKSNGSDGTVKISVDVQNDGSDPANITVRNTVFEKNGKTALGSAEKSASVTAGSITSIETSAVLSAPKLWTPESPSLYCVKTEILKGDEVLDTYETEFGFKWYEFTQNSGFKLNGKNVKLNGVCMHHDQGALGSASYYDAIYRQLMIMKDMGANAIRITHNPGAEIYVDICNEIGLLVIEEAFDGWAWKKNGNSNDFSRYFSENIAAGNQLIYGNSSMTWAEFALKSMIRRDRNDASIILWSLGNEIQEGTSDSQSWDWGLVADNLITWAKQVDETHPLTSGSNRRNLTDTVAPVMQKICAAGGVAGYNYASASELSSLHNTYGCIIASETASAVNSRGMYKTNIDGYKNASTYASQYGYHLTSYDTSKVSWGKTAQESLWDTLPDFVAGQFVWTGFDYIGEPTPWNGTDPGDGGRGAIPNSSYFGIVETTGFPKDSYYLYRSQWNQADTTLHLVTAWDPDNMMDASGTPVIVYSNAPKVELYRTVGNTTTKIGTATRTAHTSDAGHTYYTYATQSNDSVCTTQSGTNASSLYASFNVAFTSGTISAKAFDENNQEITQNAVGTKSVSTPGTVSKLSVSSNRKAIDADGYSLAYITVDVTDAAGNLKTTAENTIQFSIDGNGEIAGVDNGNQATKEKYQQSSVIQGPKSASIKAYAGKALVIVRSTKESGNFTVTASSGSLTSSSVTITTEETGTATEGSIQSYTLKKHCYAPLGTKSVTDSLPKNITASYADGSTKTLPIVWESYDADKLNKKGSFLINGSSTDGSETIPLFVTVHVYQNIAGVQCFSLCTAPKTVPGLATAAMAYDTDGSEFMEFPVVWDTADITADSFQEIDSIVTITGSVSIFGTEYPTKTTVRIGDPEVTYANVARSRARLTDNGLTNGSKGSGANRSYDDTLTAITDGNRLDDGTSDSRWSDWSNKNKTTDPGDIQIAMNWDTVTTTDRIDIYYFISDNDNDKAASVFPDDVIIQFAGGSQYNSATGMIEADKWEDVSYAKPTDIEITDSKNTVTFGKSYQLDRLINPQAIRFTFHHAAGKFIGINEVEVMNPTYTYTLNRSADLTGVVIGEETITFDAQTTDYHVSASSIQPDKITFINPENAAVTLIPQSETSVKILTVSEDGTSTKTYTLSVNPKLALTDKLEVYEKEINSSEFQNDFKDLENYDKLQTVIAEINGILEKNPDNTVIQDSLNNLETAYKNLYQEALDTKLTEYSALDASKYTADSYAKLQHQIQQIEAMNTAAMSGLELKAQLHTLTSAFKSLVNASKPPVDPDPPVDPNPPVITPPAPPVTPVTPNPKPDPKPDPKPPVTITKTTKNNVEYQILDTSKKTASAIRLTNPKAAKITIADTVKIQNVSYRVTAVNAKAFQGAKKLKNLTVGKHVAVIGKYAFKNCKVLKKVTFKGTSVNSFGKGAFQKIKSKPMVKVPKQLKKGKKRTNFLKKLKKAGMKHPVLK